MMGQVAQHHSKLYQRNGPQGNTPSFQQFSGQYQMPMNYGNQLGLMPGQMQERMGNLGNNLMQGQLPGLGCSQVTHAQGLLTHQVSQLGHHHWDD